MSKFIKVYKGTGAALTLGLGFVPERLRISEIGGNTVLEWDENSTLNGKGGVLTKSTTSGSGSSATTTVSHEVLAASAGVVPYVGGEKLDVASSAKQIDSDALAEFQGDKKGAICYWSLQTPANKTGKFDAGVNTTYVGVGSIVAFDCGEGLVTARITALTNDGDADNEVTLDKAVTSGRVVSIHYPVDFATCPAGFKMPDGITINDTTNINVSGSLYSIEAD